jgi:hypothetical protein
MRVANTYRRTTSVIGSALVFGWALWGPDHDLSRTRPPPVEISTMTPTPAVADTAPDALIARALEHDPFIVVGRSESESPQPAPTSVAIAPPLRVLGTVVDSVGGSFALCQLGAEHAVVLHIGQRIGDYELRRVDKASAVFATSDGGRVELHVPRAGA